MRPSLLVLTALISGVFAATLCAQGRPRGHTEVVFLFDDDGDGRLNAAERKEARAWLAEQNRGQNRRRGGFGRGRGGNTQPPKPGQPVAVDDIKPSLSKKLYDSRVIRTVFLTFENKEDWEAELTSFYRTDVAVPATMVMDGKTYKDVGVRFRGNSSFFGVAAGRKRSLNLAMDHADTKQRLFGYKTLNLLNAHTDPSFMREILFSAITRRYMPATNACLVHVVINGRSWGLYSNVQQVNSDFLRENYETGKGIRWKVPPNFGGDGGLRYLGDDVSRYRRAYTVKTKKNKGAFAPLVKLCKTLEQASDEDLAVELPKMLDIDEVLWFLALDNIFMDGDGYHSRASDYNLYMDPKGRFHLFFHDNNEVMRSLTGGGGPGGRRGGPGGGRGGGRGAPRTPQSPLAQASREDRPLLRRLLAIPEWKARYLAHYRTIVTEVLSWKAVGAFCKRLHAMADPYVKKDTRSLYGYAAFQTSVEDKAPKAEPEQPSFGRGGRPGGMRGGMSIRKFLDERGKFLHDHAELAGPWPELSNVKKKEVKTAKGGALHVTAKVDGKAKAAHVFLYVQDKKLTPYTRIVMHDDGQHGDGVAGDGVYGATSATFTLGNKVRYYVEARANEKTGTTTFWPRRAEAKPKGHRFGGKKAKAEKKK